MKKIYIVPVLLLLLLSTGSISNLVGSELPPQVEVEGGILERDKKIKQNIFAIESTFNEGVPHRMELIEKYGLFQRLIGSDFVDDTAPERRVFKKDDYLYYIIPEKIDVEGISKSFLNFKNDLDGEGIEFKVLLPPDKLNENNPPFLPTIDYTLVNHRELSAALNAVGIKVLDLNGVYYIEDFYHTDTHWTNKGVLKAVEPAYNFLGLEYKDMDLQEESYEKIYVGSMGKRTGDEYFTEPDSMTFYFPKSPTEYTYTKYNENGESLLENHGDFKEVFFYPEFLQGNTYDEKYIAMMNWGQYFEKIVNKNAANDKKILIIRDSFALPLSAYLAMGVEELVLVEYRLNPKIEDLKKIIELEKPDQVVFMGTVISAYYYPEMYKLD